MRCKRLFVGVEGAARRSHLLAANENLKILAFVSGKGVNYHMAPADINTNIKLLSLKLARKLSLSHTQLLAKIQFITFGMSGVFDPADLAVIESSLFKAGYNRIPHLICEDAEIALVGGGLTHTGICLISSTGAIGFARDAKGNTLRIDGWGPILGDDGSGYYLGQRALRAILRAEDHRSPACNAMKKQVLRYLQLSTAKQLVRWFDMARNTQTWRVAVADLAIPLYKAWVEDGDATADEIFSTGIRHLAETFGAILRQIKSKGLDISVRTAPVVLEGGVFEHCPKYVSGLGSTLRKQCPDINIRYAAFRPVLGALLFSLSGSRSLPELHVTNKIRNSAKLVRDTETGMTPVEFAGNENP